MKVLLIEDKEQDIQRIIDYCEEYGHEAIHEDFDNGLLKIEEHDPDIIVLDLKDSQEEFEGCKIFEKIWEHRFRPTCVFSGQIVASTIEKEEYKSPLVAFVDKGDETPVINFIEKVSPYIGCIRDVQLKAYQAMRKSFDFFDLAIKDGMRDTDIIAALCGNRIKVYFDNDNLSKKMPIWSQYIYPVVDESISTGDIIMLKSGTSQTAMQKKFFVVLSQSCDIVHGKIDDILVAKCYDIKTFSKKGPNSEGQYEDRTFEELKVIFNTGFLNQFFPLPQIEGVIPDFVINLKALKLIPKGQLKSDYKKIASLSSPYKERLIWAYMQTACRPGVPDLAVDEWANSLCPNIEATETSKQDEEDTRGNGTCGV